MRNVYTNVIILCLDMSNYTYWGINEHNGEQRKLQSNLCPICDA